MTIDIFTTYSVIICFKCGVSFAVPQSFKNALVRDHSEFWCPNGHQQAFTGKSKAQKIQATLDREREAHERTRKNVASADARTEREKRSHAATKGKLTKTHNRIKNGVCPFCNRSFKDLKAHMDTKHSAEECHG